MTFLPYLILAIVVAQRIAELIYAAKNTRRLLKTGGIEYGRKHYPLFILLHTAWLVTIALSISASSVTNYSLLCIFLLLQVMRLWILLSLGRYWTTRIIRVPDTPLVRRGPYRWLDHPNYLLVQIEIALLPLIFGQWSVALAFSIANAALLFWRIRIENLAIEATQVR